MAASASPPEKRARLSHQDGKVAENDGGVEDPAVSLFREFLRIPTVSRGEGYEKYYGKPGAPGVSRIFKEGGPGFDRIITPQRACVSPLPVPTFFLLIYIYI